MYNVWSSVLYAFQVYYKTAIFNPESNSENLKYFSELNNEHVCLATRYLSSDKPLRVNKETESSKSPAWPSHREVRLRIR